MGETVCKLALTVWCGKLIVTRLLYFSKQVLRAIHKKDTSCFFYNFEKNNYTANSWINGGHWWNWNPVESHNTGNWISSFNLKSDTGWLCVYLCKDEI